MGSVSWATLYIGIKLSKLFSGVLTLVDSKLMRMDNYKFKSTSGYWIVKHKDAVTSK